MTFSVTVDIKCAEEQRRLLRNAHCM